MTEATWDQVAGEGFSGKDLELLSDEEREELEDVLELLLKIGASMDMVGPINAMVQGAIRGPHSVFLVPYDASPLSGRQIDGLLSKRGVESWGYLVVWDTLMFSVAERHVRWATSLLGKAGVPIEAVS